MFPYALSTILYDQKPLEAALRDFKATGFNQIELWAESVHLDPRYIADVPGAVKAVRESGLICHSVHAPFTKLGFGSSDPAKVAETQKWLLKTLEICSELESPFVVIHPINTTEGLEHESAVPLLMNSFGVLADRAEQLGVQILVESLPWAPKPLDSLAGLNELFTDQRIGLCLDVAHAFLNGYDIIDEINVAPERLYSSHISNNNGQEDTHSNIFDGLIDMRRVLRRYAELPHVTPVLEIINLEDQERALEEVRQTMVELKL